MNRKAIADVLKKAPLCHGKLIQTRGLAKEYCAMGALLKAVGCTDAELEKADGGANDLYYVYSVPLSIKFGIASYTEFQTLMEANDSTFNVLDRNKEVLRQAVGITDEEIDEIFRRSHAPVSAE